MRSAAIRSYAEPGVRDQRVPAASGVRRLKANTVPMDETTVPLSMTCGFSLYQPYVIIDSYVCKMSAFLRLCRGVYCVLSRLYPSNVPFLLFLAGELIRPMPKWGTVLILALSFIQARICTPTATRFNIVRKIENLAALKVSEHFSYFGGIARGIGCVKP